MRVALLQRQEHKITLKLANASRWDSKAIWRANSQRCDDGDEDDTNDGIFDLGFLREDGMRWDRDRDREMKEFWLDYSRQIKDLSVFSTRHFWQWLLPHTDEIESF